MNFTAATIAAALDMKRQAVQWHLRNLTPAGIKVIRGKEAGVFELAALPPKLAAMLEAAREKSGFHTVAAMLAKDDGQRRPSPELPELDQVEEEEIQRAIKLRDALRSFLVNQHTHGLKPGEWKQNGVAAYRQIFGHDISERWWIELFNSAVQRDAGAEKWDNLKLYFRKNPRLKLSPDAPLQVSPDTPDEFENLGALIAQLHNPLAPTEEERKAVWSVALREYLAAINAGQNEKSAARRMRDYLFDHAKFLAPTRNALRMNFERRLAKWQPENPQSLNDGRAGNGDVAEYPREDIRRVRHSAVLKNNGRIDEAWREEYKLLSEYTRQRHPYSIRCPQAFSRRVNRIKVDALRARIKSRRTLRHLVGGIKRDASKIPSMARWTVDDWTSNIEVAFPNPDGTWSLIQPQIITAMDFASRKWVGWSVSNDKGPTAQLVCAAIMDGFKRHGVPSKIVVENGFVFGKSLNINGKVDDQGRSIVAGLAQYGCTVHHFGKASPTSKGELEKSFDLVQRRMERHPGYTGRLQMLDASDDFRREQRMIRSGHVDATKHRYTFDEFVSRVFPKMIDEYNATPQQGHLNGISPNEAFEALKNLNDPPIKFDNQLYWMLANERYRVTVEAGGVTFRHYGRKIQVRGGELPQHVGKELWALVDRADSSLVTFMSLDHSQTFTVETCRQPSADEPRIATGESVLAAEIKKRGEHERAVSDELDSLKKEFGNPRLDLLAQIRNQTPALSNIADSNTRKVILNSRIQNSASQMETQRADITARRKKAGANKTKASRMGINPVLADDSEDSGRGLELLAEARGDSKPHEKSAAAKGGEVEYQLKPFSKFKGAK